MKTVVLLYEGCVQTEVVLTTFILKKHTDILTVAMKDLDVLSYEQYNLKADCLLSEVNPNDVDLFIIPGGDPNNIQNEERLYDFINQLNEKKKVVGAICAGPLQFLKAGILKGRNYTAANDVYEHFKDEFNDSFFMDTNVCVDDHIITAKMEGYIDFAIEISHLLGIFKSEEEKEGLRKFLKQ